MSDAASREWLDEDGITRVEVGCALDNGAARVAAPGSGGYSLRAATMTTAALDGLSSNEEERAFLQARVALFWKVVFLISLAADVVQLFLIPLRSQLAPGAVLDRLATAGFGALWFLSRRGTRSVRFLMAIEAVGLAVASIAIALMGRYLVTETLPVFVAYAEGASSAQALESAVDAYVSMMVMLGGSLLFAVRAALVPSTSRRTFVLTVFLGLPYVAVPILLSPASAGFPALRSTALSLQGSIVYALWWMIVAVGAAVVSQVVHGLRAAVREARRLGQYTLEGKLGEGGMGVVYRARHGMMRRPTAVKLLRPDRAGDAQLRRFEREVQLTARLSHPHTITIFDYGRTPDGIFYYAMELLDGASLEVVVNNGGSMPPARVIHLLFHVAGALTEAHELGLIHRDIKPANIILCRQGGIDDFPKVVDFGLVKDVEQGAAVGLTQADVVTGTPLYLAPEALTAPESVGPRSDLYSLGATAYFALTGSPLFAGRTLVEVCSHHLHSKPEPPSTRLHRPVPSDLESLILDCLEKDPSRRPSSAQELAGRLEACAAFGRWTAEDAREWWRQNRAAVVAQYPEAQDAPLTLTRRLDTPRAALDGAPHGR